MKCWPPFSPFLNLPHVSNIIRIQSKTLVAAQRMIDQGTPNSFFARRTYIYPTITVRWNQKNWVSCMPYGCIYAHSELLELWELCS